jgi:predicted metal-dependent hydrolase
MPENAWQEALSLYNQEKFWEVHEVLEVLWLKAVAPEKQWIQGVILIAAGWVHFQRGRLFVIEDLWKKGLRRLEGVPEVYHGFPMKFLITQTHAQLDCISAGETLTPFQLPTSL